MSSRNNRWSSPRPPAAQERPKRHLKTKPVLILLSILFIGNVLWFIAWLIPNKPEGQVAASNEEVAEVNGESITREEWMAVMEENHGRDTLRTLVNQKVMETAAKEYDIEVTDEEIDLELAMQRSVQEESELAEYPGDEARLRDSVRSRLILEKVLTKDVIIEDEAVRDYYEENESLYDVKDAYRTMMIVLNTEAEAEEAIKELENGSSFEALARERSVDAATGSLGGDLGYITPEDGQVEGTVADTAASLKAGEWSEPVPLSNGRYAVIMVTEVAEGRTFTFDEVEEHIRRELALEQLPQSVTPEAFWKEFDAEWFYGD